MKAMVRGLLVCACVSGALQAVTPAEEWNNIIVAVKKVSASDEVQDAVDQACVAIQNTLSLAAKKMVQEISVSEKARLATLMMLAQRMLATCEDAVRIGGKVTLDGQAAAEFNGAIQELMVAITPLLMLAGNQDFVVQQEALLQGIRVATFEQVKRVVDQISNELQ